MQIRDTVCHRGGRFATRPYGHMAGMQRLCAHCFGLQLEATPLAGVLSAVLSGESA